MTLVATYQFDGVVYDVVIGAATPRRRGRPGWERVHGGLGGKLGAIWRHTASGRFIEHCGHLTANFPYCAYDGQENGQTLVAPSGRGFRRLADAQEAVEQLLAAGEVAA